jgi:TIR domain
MLGEPEIFISYAHADNDHPRYESREWEHARGWVECFYDALTKRLRQLRGRETLVWRDQSGRIKGASALTDTIKDGLRTCPVLITVVSPAYLASGWCADELRFFREAAAERGGLRVGNLLRVVKINKLPVFGDSFLSRDPDLADATGYAFYRSVGGNPLEFDPPHGSELGQPFLNEINTLAADIVELLDGPRVAPSGVTVFLAETSADVEDLRGKLRTELVQFGHAVLPSAASSHDISDSAQVGDHLARARLSIHVLGRQYAAIPEGRETSTAELQYDLAGEQLRRSDFTRLTWLPPGVEPADARQAAFVERVRSFDSQFVTAPLEDVKTQIKDALRPKPIGSEQRRAPSDVKIVYLIFEPPDEEHAELVRKWLDGQGFEVLKPTRSGSLKAHRINLRDSDGVLIYYGQTDDDWLTVKLHDLRKTFGQGRDRRRPLRGAVYLADPEEPDKAKFSSHIVDVIPGFGRFRPETLRGFIDCL